MSDRRGAGHGASRQASETRDPTIDDGCGPGNIMVVLRVSGERRFLSWGVLQGPQNNEKPQIDFKIYIRSEKKSV